MKKSILIVSILLFSLSLIFKSQAQHSTLGGVVSGSASGEVISFANIVLIQNATQIMGCNTDINGNYFFQTIPPGEYQLIASFIGYIDFKIDSLRIVSGQAFIQNIVLRQTLVSMQEFEVVRFRKPLIDAEQAFYMTESPRDNTQIYFIDGVKVRGYCDNISGVKKENFSNESYEKRIENSFKSPIVSPFSTFSIDVDRASYANVRRFVTNDRLPPVDAIRIEEMINYFHYSYPEPEEGIPFSINLEAGDCPWNENTKLVKVGIKGKSLLDEEIPKSNLVFLIDVSGSMSTHNKLELVKKSLKILVNNLQDDDKVSIVVYAGAAGCVLEPTSGKNKKKIIDVIETLGAGGSTAGGQGIKLAYKIAQNNYIKRGNNRVILLTDGDFNVGVSDDNELIEIIKNKRESGVYLTILGFGVGNYKDSKMEKLSNAGNGNYGYIDNLMEAKKMFGVELWATLFTIAQDVKIQIEFNPALVLSYRLIGYENRMLETEDFNNDSVDAGEIGAGHTVTAFYEIVLNVNQDRFNDSFSFQKIILIDTVNLLKARIRYKKPGQKTSHLVEGYLHQNLLDAENSKDFNFATSVIEYGLLIRNSDYKADASFKNVQKRAKRAYGEDEHGYRHSFVQMVNKTELLNSLSLEQH